MQGFGTYARPATPHDDLLCQARIHLGCVARSRTVTPVSVNVEVAGHLISLGDLTDIVLFVEPGFRQQLVALEYEPEPPENDEPGAPSAAVLLRAFAELTQRLSLTQDNLARYVGIGPTTVMAWKRERSIHPRHPRVPLLLSLWAAVSGAFEELGEAETLRRVWASGSGASDGLPGLPADELAEQLIVAADEAARDDDEDDGYDPATAALLTTEEIAAGEQELSIGLGDYLEGRDESGLA